MHLSAIDMRQTSMGKRAACAKTEVASATSTPSATVYRVSNHVAHNSESANDCESESESNGESESESESESEVDDSQTDAKGIVSGGSDDEHEGELPPAHEILSLYCMLQPGVSVAKFCRHHSARLSDLHIDPRRFIAFGVMHRFLRRLFVYPEFVGHISTVSSVPDMHRTSDVNFRSMITHGRENAFARTGGRTSAQHMRSHLVGSTDHTAVQNAGLQRELLHMCDGNHSTDEICSRFMISYAQLEAWLRQVQIEGTGEVFMTCHGAIM